MEVLEILTIISLILLKTVENYQQYQHLFVLLIRIAWIHVSTGYLVIARPVSYTKNKNYNRNLILWLD